MAWQAKHKYARISARKARLIADMIRGMEIQEALNSLKFAPNRGAGMIAQVLKSAIANAKENEADEYSLVVSEARVDEGPTMKRWHPKDRGRAHPIMKRTSHIVVAVDER